MPKPTKKKRRTIPPPPLELKEPIGRERNRSEVDLVLAKEVSLLSFICRVNFANILRAAFTCKDAKSAKKLLNLTVSFALLGSARVKAACRTLVKLTPDLLSQHQLMPTHARERTRPSLHQERYQTCFMTVASCC